ncbi:hypothetical protein D3C86_2175010 [compost metagenome]
MGEAVLFGRLLDREGMPSALEMIVGQDRTADNRQIRVGPDEIMRERLYKGEQPL